MQIIRWLAGGFIVLVIVSYAFEGRVLTALGILAALLILGGTQLLVAVGWQSIRRDSNRARTFNRRALRTRSGDQFADELKGLLQSGKPTPRFALYLRAFEFDRRSQVDVRLDQFNAYTTSVEAMLGEALGGKLPVVGIGVRLGYDRPGMFEVPDADWQATFELLAERAALVCVVPIVRPGLGWEIQRLAEREHLEKTCLLVPPAGAIRAFPGGMTDALRSLDKLGYRIPPLGDDGGVVRVGVRGDARRSYEPFPQDEHQMRADLERLFPLLF